MDHVSISHQEIPVLVLTLFSLWGNTILRSKLPGYGSSQNVSKELGKAHPSHNPLHMPLHLINLPVILVWFKLTVLTLSHVSGIEHLSESEPASARHRHPPHGYRHYRHWLGSLLQVSTTAIKYINGSLFFNLKENWLNLSNYVVLSFILLQYVDALQ